MRILKLIIIIGALILAGTLIKNIAGIASVRNRVSEAQKTVERLENEQKELKKKLEEASSSAILERTARNELGLAKLGETVVVLPNDDFLKTLSPSLEVEDREPEIPNWKKWMERFF